MLGQRWLCPQWAEETRPGRTPGLAHLLVIVLHDSAGHGVNTEGEGQRPHHNMQRLHQAQSSDPFQSSNFAERGLTTGPG